MGLLAVLQLLFSAVRSFILAIYNVVGTKQDKALDIDVERERPDFLSSCSNGSSTTRFVLGNPLEFEQVGAHRQPKVVKSNVRPCVSPPNVTEPAVKKTLRYSRQELLGLKKHCYGPIESVPMEIQRQQPKKGNRKRKNRNQGASQQRDLSLGPSNGKEHSAKKEHLPKSSPQSSAASTPSPSPPTKRPSRSSPKHTDGKTGEGQVSRQVTGDKGHIKSPKNHKLSSDSSRADKTDSESGSSKESPQSKPWKGIPRKLSFSALNNHQANSSPHSQQPSPRNHSSPRGQQSSPRATPQPASPRAINAVIQSNALADAFPNFVGFNNRAELQMQHVYVHQQNKHAPPLSLLPDILKVELDFAVEAHG